MRNGIELLRTEREKHGEDKIGYGYDKSRYALKRNRLKRKGKAKHSIDLLGEVKKRK